MKFEQKKQKSTVISGQLGTRILPKCQLGAGGSDWAFMLSFSMYSNWEINESASAYMLGLSMDWFMARESTDCRDNERAILSTVARVHPYTLLLPHSESCTLAHSYSLYLPRNESCTFVSIYPLFFSYCECCTCGHFTLISFPSAKV